MTSSRPDAAALRAELASIERHLHELPPHSGQGHRARLEERATELRRQLARLGRGRP